MRNATHVIFRKLLILFTSISLLSSCTYRPILDQNSHYLKVGENASQSSIDACIQKADTYLKQYKARRALKTAGRKSVLGAVFGVIFGAIFGNTTKSVISGLAVGAGIGATSGIISVAGEGTLTPDQIKRNYVSNCLSRQGYSVIGWE